MRVVLSPQREYTREEIRIPETTGDYFAIYVDVSQMTLPTQCVSILLEVTSDGKRWEKRYFKFTGAPHGPRWNPLNPFSKFGFSLPPGRNRLVRGSLHIEGRFNSTFELETR